MKIINSLWIQNIQRVCDANKGFRWISKEHVTNQLNKITILNSQHIANQYFQTIQKI